MRVRLRIIFGGLLVVSIALFLLRPAPPPTVAERLEADAVEEAAALGSLTIQGSEFLIANRPFRILSGPLTRHAHD